MFSVKTVVALVGAFSATLDIVNALPPASPPGGLAARQAPPERLPSSSIPASRSESSSAAMVESFAPLQPLPAGFSTTAVRAPGGPLTGEVLPSASVASLGVLISSAVRSPSVAFEIVRETVVVEAPAVTVVSVRTEVATVTVTVCPSPAPAAAAIPVSSARVQPSQPAARPPAAAAPAATSARPTSAPAAPVQVPPFERPVQSSSIRAGSAAPVLPSVSQGAGFRPASSAPFPTFRNSTVLAASVARPTAAGALPQSSSARESIFIPVQASTGGALASRSVLPAQSGALQSSVRVPSGTTAAAPVRTESTFPPPSRTEISGVVTATAAVSSGTTRAAIPIFRRYRFVN